MPIWLLLLLIGGGSAWLLARHRPKPLSFVLLGDSLAVGLAPHMREWARSNGLPFSQDAQVGRSTRAQSASLVTPGSLVFISLGTNDAVSLTDGHQINIFADEVHRRGAARIIWLIPPATKALPSIGAVRAAIRSARVDIATTSTPLRADGLHPANYAAAFQNLLPALDN